MPLIEKIAINFSYKITELYDAEIYLYCHNDELFICLSYGYDRIISMISSLIENGQDSKKITELEEFIETQFDLKEFYVMLKDYPFKQFDYFGEYELLHDDGVYDLHYKLITNEYKKTIDGLD